MADWFQQLNSNDPKIVEDAKQKFCEQFSTVKEPWLVNGLYDQYIATNSIQILEILINVRDSHHDYLFNKLHESLVRGTNEIKFQALILLGHVVRKHPTWLFKITEKALFKELLKLLKNETDILLLLSALLLLIVLLPCIPSLMGPHLQDVFEIFSRLAAFTIPVKMGEDQLVHMQVGLYALLQRLYGMYPCNFLAYLRSHYKNKEASNIFKHTIKPMLQTVHMHPLLVTSTKDYELSTERWKEMTAHDVVVECERYSIGLKDRFTHDACLAGGPSFRSRSGTTNSTTLEPYYLLKNMQVGMENDFFSPSQMMNYIQTPPAMGNETPTAAIPVAQFSHQHQGAGQSLLASSTLQSQEGTSPPEAAIEATPETTPIKDMRLLSSQRQQQHSIAHVTVARALNNFGNRNRSSGVGSPNTTPTHSQPSSPMRLGNKDALSAFSFAQSSMHSTEHHYHHHHQLHRSAFNQPINNKRESLANQKLQKIMQDRTQLNEGVPTIPFTQIPPASPLRLIPTEPISTNLKRTESPLSQEDEEVQSIVKISQTVKHQPLRQCDSVIQDHEHNPDCEKGSPCISGGLHMPNSKQMNAFKNNMKRLRHHSQCAPDTDVNNDSTGSSPGSKDMILTNVTVRRANSCPDMKKNTSTSSTGTKDGIVKTLEEKDEDQPEMNGFDQQDAKKKKITADVLTQTESIGLMPYEHLFLSIFPAYESNEIKPSPAPSPAFYQAEKFNYASTYDVLDKYVDFAFQHQATEGKDSVKYLKEQLQLVQQQLMFERARRETHATKNRTLFTDVTKIKVLEEHNSALSDLVKLLETDIDNLKHKIDKYKQEKQSKDHEQFEKMQYWEKQYRTLFNEISIVNEKNEDLMHELVVEKEKLMEINKSWQKAESSLVNAEAEAKVYKEQVLAGERGRIELERVNRELLLAGETIVKYRERLTEASSKTLSDVERAYYQGIYQQELKTLHHQLELKTTALGACRSHIAELNNTIQRHDESTTVQKRLINDIKEECNEKMKAIESKYQSQLSINRALEVKILELYQQETTSRQGLHSPDTSSCHEVNASTERTTGLSPHSSPLSASLTSSEGSMAFMQSDIKDMKTLQAIVDQKESNTMKSSATDNDLSMDTCINSSWQTMASTSKQTD